MAVMETIRIHKDFDLPTKHIKGRHFVPPRARDQEEIDRRRQLPKGVLLAEYQERGLAVASTILKFVEDPQSIRFASRLISASGLNSAWYSFARGAEHEVMRRRLKLPMLAVNDPTYRENTEDMLYTAAYALGEDRAIAAQLVTALETQSPQADRYKRKLGRMVGNASLHVACVELGDKLVEHPLASADTQLLVRQRSLGTLQDARNLGKTIGVHPSIAQLADPDSNLSVFWRREAPNGALQAYENAIELRLAA